MAQEENSCCVHTTGATGKTVGQKSSWITLCFNCRHGSPLKGKNEKGKVTLIHCFHNPQTTTICLEQVCRTHCAYGDMWSHCGRHHDAKLLHHLQRSFGTDTIFAGLICLEGKRSLALSLSRSLAPSLSGKGGSAGTTSSRP